MLFQLQVSYGDGLPDQICTDCLDNLVAFSAFRKKIEIGQIKLNAIISTVQYSMNPTFLPPLGESDFRNTNIFKYYDSIEKAKALIGNSSFSHLVNRTITDRVNKRT